MEAKGDSFVTSLPLSSSFPQVPKIAVLRFMSLFKLLRKERPPNSQVNLIRLIQDLSWYKSSYFVKKGLQTARQISSG